MISFLRELREHFEGFVNDVVFWRDHGTNITQSTIAVGNDKSSTIDMYNSVRV